MGKFNDKQATCIDCGHVLKPGEGLVEHDGIRCQNRTQCARRVVRNGTNARALKEVARDYEHLGTLATQARQKLVHKKGKGAKWFHWLTS